MTVGQWREFLQLWSDEWLRREIALPARVRKTRWLGTRPASEKQIAQLEKRIGYQLPPSYRNFLLTSNGWSHTSELIEQVRPASKVEWLITDDPQLLDVWAADDDLRPMDGVPSEEYFAYDGRPIFDRQHFRESLVIADPVVGDSMIYVLNPLVVAEDGEWEAWRFANWIPGAERFPSFALLMRAEHATFLAALAANGQSGELGFGPYEGVYAPDRPRHKAQAMGNARAKPPRLTIPQLIAQLESPGRNARLAAAKQLFREHCPHDPENEHPELVEPLGRIIASQLEPDVRAAAVSMLGSFGDIRAIPLLIHALDDPQLTTSAVGALFYLSLYMHDTRIGDAMMHLLESSHDYYVIDKAMSILQELKDLRVAEIGLRLLDHADKIPFDIPSTADFKLALEHRRSSLRMTGAFAYAQFAEKPASTLVTRCKDADAGVRAAAIAALRKCPDKGPELVPLLESHVKDPDPIVQQQAQMTLRFLEPLPQVEISPERLAEVVESAEKFLRRAKSRKKNF